MRGELVDIGGHRLRAVRAGPERAKPLIVCEHGAFGCAADWSVIQEKLAAKGLRSIAYDRAGMGLSEPGPHPRDGCASNADLLALLEALGEPGPYLLVGHSMGGLMVRLFALTFPEKVLGLVLVDAMTPDVLSLPGGTAAIGGFGKLLKLASFGAKFGAMQPVSRVTANLIGLTGEAAAEKRRIHGSANHARWAAEEVAQWPVTSAALCAGPIR
jgi:pimeloyl-ACP methyl ester carboxylesterase